MNVPQIYLVEPYNAYAPKNRKKHPAEVLEEQALLERIIAEAKNASLPENSPNISVATAAGQSAAGGGGIPLFAYFAPRMTANFLVSVTTASAPSTFLFSNSSNPDLLADGVATFLWTFGDGSTSTAVNPTYTYTTTGSNFNVTLKATSIATNATASVTQSLNITAPTVVAGFNVSSSLSASTAGAVSGSISGSNPVTVQFINNTTTNNAANTISYIWTFGSGSVTSSLANPSFTYTATGSYTVRLTATGSFNIASSASRVAVVVVS